MATPRRLLIICKGNICRSPAAEAVIRALAGTSVAARSRGTHGWHVGKGAHPTMGHIAAERGYDLSRHIAARVTADDLAWADDILVMERANQDRLAQNFPPGLISHARTYLATGEDLPDPYGLANDAFAHALDLIETGAFSYLEKLRMFKRRDSPQLGLRVD